MDDIVSPLSPDKAGKICGPSKRRFQAILDEGFRVGGKLISVVAVPALAQPKAGIATPRAVGCHARRNRQRRRLRAALRNLTPLLGGMEIVVLSRLSLVEATHQEISSELQQLLIQCRNRLTAGSEPS